MRFPHPDFSELCLFSHSPDILIKALGSYAAEGESQLIREYCADGLPPVTSVSALAVMTGFNPGFIWSMLSRPNKHYRTFSIPKGKGVPPRVIRAPKVGLKAIQTWLSAQWTRKYNHHESSFGFVPGRSHAHAAKRHLKAKWVVSVDIENFFPSILQARATNALHKLGYKDIEGTSVLSSLVCLDGALTQGSPASPILSNIVLRDLDEKLELLAQRFDATFTRYADDIVFSGGGEKPDTLLANLISEVTDDGWTISDDKIYSATSPSRLKVHGLLVHGNAVRLTKGYRNRIRAYRHLLSHNKISSDDLPSILGHVSYSNFIDSLK